MTHMTNLDQLNSAIFTINRIKGEVEASMRGILSPYRRDQGVKDFGHMVTAISSNLPLMSEEEAASMPNFAKPIIWNKLCPSLCQVAVILDATWNKIQAAKEAKQSAEPIVSALHTEAIKDDSDFMLVQHALTDLGRAADDQVMDAMQAAFDAVRLAH